jgi:hypothetical protein
LTLRALWLARYAITFEEARVRGDSRLQEDGYIDDLASPGSSIHDDDTSAQRRKFGSRIIKQEAV